MTTKPFKEYSEQRELLSSRGMIIRNADYVEKKLSQIGYYRLSGFWHTARKPINEKQLGDQFLPNTQFEQIHNLYLFDKKLRILLLDIIERLEVNVRTVLAHEMGRFTRLSMDDNSQRRLFGRIAVMWYLIRQASVNYKWLEKVNEVLEEFPEVPNAKLKALGLMHHKYLPLELMRL